MRKAIFSVLVVSMITLPVTGCASFFSLGSHSAKVRYNDTKWCVPRSLKRVLDRVADTYGPVTVHSTKRWWLENWLKGGARNSYHLKCQAVDFSVAGDPESVIAFLKAQPEVGGYAHYPGSHYHIDNGPRRTW